MNAPTVPPCRTFPTPATAVPRAAPALLVLLSLVLVCGLRAADPAPRTFNVPEGDAATTLPQFIEQSGEQLVYLVDQVRGVRTNAVRGELTARSALERMLAGTPLVAVQDDKTKALVVNRQAPGAGAGGASPAATTPRVGGASPASAPDMPEAAGMQEDAILLPSFTVRSATDDSYIGRQALSTTRTGVELIDLGQSVKVLNRTFIDDINPTLVVDALKYVGGGQAGNINFADDRFTLRGFNSPADIGDFVDGFRAKIDSNTDLAIIDRLEIIKGPSAIFVANGPVGGVINKITKSPVSYDLRTLKLQAGLFDANRVELDVGGRLTANKRLLYRVVAAYHDSEGWYDHTYDQRLVFAPSLRYAFSPDSELTLKYFYFDFDFGSYNGLPFDERTGRRIDIRRKSTLSEDDPLNWRSDKVHRGLLEYTNRINEYVALRVAGFVSRNEAARVESVYGGYIPAGFVEGTPVNRSTTAQEREHPRRHLQTDFVFTFPTGPLKHRLLVGGELSDAPDETASFTGSSSAIDPFNLDFPGTVIVGDTPANHIRVKNNQRKLFVLETITLLEDRLHLSVGTSGVWAETSSRNLIAGTSTPELSLKQQLWQYGAVWKITPDVSLFYGYNENFAPNFLSGQVRPSQLGEQQEIGLKAELLDKRLSLNLAYFDIQQKNVPVLSFPQTTPPSFVLVPGQTSKGFDGDISFAVTKEFDTIVTFAFMDAEARSQANSAAPVVRNPVNNVAETTFGIWGRYKFKSSETLRGLAIGAGASYLSKRAITDNPNARLFGYLDSFVTVDLQVSYDRGPFRYALNVSNLLDEEYDAAVRNQSIIVPGAGTNVKASVTVKF